MASKNPLGRLADTAISTLKNPLDTAGKVVEQAKGTAALGRMVAEQVGKSAVSKAADTAGAVVGRATGRTHGAPETYAPREDVSDTKLRPVPDVNEPGHTPAENKGAARTPAENQGAAKTAAAEKSPAKTVSATPADVAQVVESAVAENPGKTAATKASTPARKAAAKKAATKKAPAKKATAKKSSPGDKLPRKSTGGGKAPKSAEQVKDLEGTDLLETPAGVPAAGPGSNPDTTEKELHQPGTEGIVQKSTAKKVASETAKLRKAAEKNPE